MKSILYPAQLDTSYTGKLKINTTSILGSTPISSATIRISSTGQPETVIEEVRTNAIGQTEEIELPTPSEALSMEPSAEQPYSEYNLEIIAPGFETIEIIGAEVFPNTTSIQNANMMPMVRVKYTLPVVFQIRN